MSNHQDQDEEMRNASPFPSSPTSLNGPSSGIAAIAEGELARGSGNSRSRKRMADGEFKPISTSSSSSPSSSFNPTAGVENGRVESTALSTTRGLSTEVETGYANPDANPKPEAEAEANPAANRAAKPGAEAAAEANPEPEAHAKSPGVLAEREHQFLQSWLAPLGGVSRAEAASFSSSSSYSSFSPFPFSPGSSPPSSTALTPTEKKPVKMKRKSAVEKKTTTTKPEKSVRFTGDVEVIRES